MSAVVRDEKTGATAFPQQVTWPNSNEARQERLNLGVKGAALKEDEGFKHPTMVSTSRVHAAAGAPPVAIGAQGSSTRSDGRTQGATKWSTQGHHNGERVPVGTNSSRREHRVDDRVPGAVVMPGFVEEGIGQHDDDQSYSDHSQYSEAGRNESNESSPHAVTARVVDPEEEHRVLREQLQQVLREERAQAHVAVVHPASIGSGMEHGNKSVLHAAGSDSDGDVERGNMTVGQAPIININANVEQTSAMHVDRPKTGGFWHGTRGRLVIAALILVIVAVAIGVTLALVLPSEPDKVESSSQSTPPPTLDPATTSWPTTSEPTTTASTIEPTNPSPTTIEPTNPSPTTIEPTTPSPTTIEPTPLPTTTQTVPESNSTSAPTQPPTPEQTPGTTSPPTPPASPVNNNNCSNAWPLAVDGTVTVGSNENGMYASACDQFADDSGPAAWFRFTGTGRTIKVSTCNANTTDFATVVSVLSSTDGTCSPDKLECQGTTSGFDAEYYSKCPTPGTGTTVSVETVLNTVYYASVTGNAGVVGKFGLTVFDDSVGCEDDKEPHPVDGIVYAGSNENGKYVSACDVFAGDYGRGAWYRFIGTGRPITVSTCNANTTDFATVVSVLSSKDGTCGSDKLVCGKTASGFDAEYYSGCPTPETGCTVSIETVLNSVYYASVIGHQGAVGEFGISIFGDSPAIRRILPQVVAPAFENEVIADPRDGSVAKSKGLNTTMD